MIPKLHFQYISLLSFGIILLNLLFFAGMSVDLIFLFGNFIVVLLSLFFIRYCQSNYLKLQEKTFVRKIFWFSLGLRVFAVLFYWILFYFITGTEFDVEPFDAVWYDEVARNTSDSFSNGTLTFASFFIDIRGATDDSGYIMFLAIVYNIFNNSIIVARLLQALISAFSVVLIYKIGENIFDAKTGKLSAILSATFQPFLLYASIHMKETLMIYFLLLFIYQSIKLCQKKISISVISTLLISLCALFTFRTVLGLIAFGSLLGYLIIASQYSFVKKSLILISMSVLMFFLTAKVPIFNEIADKAERYAGVQTETKGTVGGRTENQLSSSQSFAKYAGGGIFLVQSIIMPYPSMVKTNIGWYNQTLQWYYGGGLIIWVFLSYYAYIGLYHSCINLFKKSSILLFIMGIYTVALISSLYITSIRFNIVKMALLIPFIAYGINMSSVRVKNNFIKYAMVVSLIILLWNYIKLAGRGEI